MLIYKNTFDNVKTIGFNFPVEDQYYADETTAIVADGITRDPIGIADFSSASSKQFVEKYPRPSGAYLAAKEICDTFSKEDGTLKEKLIKSGANVIMTRDGDFDLSSPNANRRKKSDFDNRVSLINNAGADLYISIHLNYLSDSRYSGAQVFYTKGNEYLAEIMQESLASYLKTKMPAKKLSDTIYMYKKLKVPGILIECGFLSNENERNLLIS